MSWCSPLYSTSSLCSYAAVLIILLPALSALIWQSDTRDVNNDVVFVIAVFGVSDETTIIILFFIILIIPGLLLPPPYCGI